ncbi:MAG: hypothetical protein Ct9H90mP20_6870 [Candidatus Neomarinimicrobiota bacterium]|nr:MAG: hypothetical protein Ct9H90mP20_6870 [Candidatus Neomarinimicrobiota bacterium]
MVCVLSLGTAWFASQEESDQLYKFGYNLGLAFQIKDDYLEIFGDENLMGKSLGSDLDEQKQTIMTITARKMIQISGQSSIKKRKICHNTKNTLKATY